MLKQENLKSEEIAKDAHKTINAFHQGQLLPKSVTEVIAELEATLIENK
jgi:hypothetical protein